MSGKRSYSMFELISISELDAQSGVRRHTSKDEYFGLLDQFCRSAIGLIGCYSHKDLQSKTAEILENLPALQELLIQIQALHLSWRVERLSAVLKEGNFVHATTLLATTQEQVRSLSKKIEDAAMPCEDIPDEAPPAKPLADTAVKRDSTQSKPPQSIKYDMFERLFLLVDNFELGHAAAELAGLMKFSYSAEIDESLESINGYLMGFDYVNASAECRRLLGLAKLALASHTEKEPNKKPEILAIDDLPDVLNTLKAMLKRQYNVYGMTSHETALRYLASHNPELILLDIEMPEMDGYTLLTLIKKLPAHKQTPVIFLTGNSGEEHIRRARELGASDFIKKPVDLASLSSKIEFHIRNSPKNAE